MNGAALAADIPLKAPRPQPVLDWTGLYFGAHAGFGRGFSDATLTDPAVAATGNFFGGPFGGLQAGYNFQLPSRIVLGLEADVTFPNYIHGNSVISMLATAKSFVFDQMDFAGSLRGRLGYAAGPWLFYATGGLAFSGERFLNMPADGNDEKLLRMRPGWIAGGGAEFAFAPHWSLRLQYLYSPFEKPPVQFASRAPRAPPPSLTPAPQAKATWSNSLFLNTRLWEGGELYYNPELLQGFGLNDTVGAGGFPNGEAQKSNFPYPHYNTSRLFLRQTFGFGGEQEELASGPTQLASKVDVSRLTVQAGKFAVIDIFDGNAYAKDSRKDFMNWSMWAPGAFDYSADKVGLTYGATAEFNQKQWALRGGYFLMPAVSNANNFATAVFKRGTYALELETRWSLFSLPGKLRTIAWLNSAFSGSYRETLNDPALNLDIALTRTGRT